MFNHRAMFLLVCSMVVLTQSSGASMIDGRNYYGRTDCATGLNWPRTGKWNLTAKNCDVLLRIFDKGNFDYETQGIHYYGYVQDTAGGVAFFFEILKGKCLNASVSSDGDLIDTGLFQLSTRTFPASHGQLSGKVYSGVVDSGVANHWFLGGGFPLEGRRCSVTFRFNVDSSFLYETPEVTQKGTYKEPEMNYSFSLRC